MPDTKNPFITSIPAGQAFYCRETFLKCAEDLHDFVAGYITAKRGDPDDEDQVRALFEITAVYPARPIPWPCLRHTILNINSIEEQLFDDVSDYNEEPEFELTEEARKEIDAALAAIADRLTAALPKQYTANTNARFDPGVLTQRYLATNAK
jgi:hypothetical protein